MSVTTALASIADVADVVGICLVISGFGTTRTSRHVRSMSAVEGKSDIHRTALDGSD